MGEFFEDVAVEINIRLARMVKLGVVDSYERGGEDLKVSVRSPRGKLWFATSDCVPPATLPVPAKDDKCQSIAIHVRSKLLMPTETNIR